MRCEVVFRPALFQPESKFGYVQQEIPKQQTTIFYFYKSQRAPHGIGWIGEWKIPTLQWNISEAKACFDTALKGLAAGFGTEQKFDTYQICFDM